MTAKAKRAKKTKRAATGTLKLEELELQQLLAVLKKDPDLFRGTTPLTGVYREAERALEKLKAKSAKGSAVEQPVAETTEKVAAVEKPEATPAAEASSSSPVLKPSPRWWWPGA
jgi:hypothetical protein